MKFSEEVMAMCEKAPATTEMKDKNVMAGMHRIMEVGLDAFGAIERAELTPVLESVSMFMRMMADQKPMFISCEQVAKNPKKGK